MKKYAALITALFFIIAYKNVYSQTTTYPFTVKKSGHGKRSIIFIPGFGCSGEVWNETRSKFEKKFTCYTLTMAGFAGTTPQPNATFGNWEAGIAKYIKDKKISRPILVGHSMGGGLTLAIASDYPELISKIVIVDALPCLSALMDPAFKSKEDNDCTGIAKQIASMSKDQFYQMQKMSISTLLADSSKQELVLDWTIKSDRKTFGQMYCDFSNADLREKIKAVRCPSLILLESYFSNVRPGIESQYKNLKNADIQYATTGKHFIMYDDKDWYFGHLANFLKTK